MIKKIIEDNLCAGCGLCESKFGKEKVRISFNKEGFLRPVFSERLTKKENSLFEQICPGVNAKHFETKNHDTLWGPYLSIKSGHAIDDKIRHLGSSGGVLTALATYLLNEKKVECVLHIGAIDTKPYLNTHKISYTVEEVLNNAGSRYAPSATLINFLDVFQNHTSIAVIGKPCDIVGVRNLIRKTPEAEKKTAFLLSFMCAGVPSQNATSKIINKSKIKINNIESLKYRGEGWPGYFKITDKSKKTYKMSYNESWGTVLNKELQFRCKICADGTGEFADLTCADAWEESSEGYPSFKEKEGKSLVIIRNQSGKTLIENAISKGYIKITDRNISSNDVSKMQPYQKLRKQNLLPRLLALKLLGRSIPKYNYKILLMASLKENPLRLVKNFLGMLKRVLKKKKR